MKTTIVFKATRPMIFGRQIHLMIGARTGEEMAIAQPMVFTVVEQDCVADDIFKPSLAIEPEDAQALMDELWHVGIRPSEGSGSAGQMAATIFHLEDMRKLVFEAPAEPRTEYRPGPSHK